jgi:hypothetical protein
MSMTARDFEVLILEAIVDEGDLTTLGAENGVEIDGHGPSDGNTRPIEGWYTKDGKRAYFSATVVIRLEEFLPDYDDDDDQDEGIEDDGEG